MRPGWIVARTYTGPLLLEFLAGIWLGVAWSRGRLMIPPAVGIGLLVVAAAVLAGGYAFGTDDGTYSRLLARGVPAVLIVIGMLSFETLAVVRNRIGLLLGAASYAIYLSHPAVMLLVRMICAKMHLIEPWTILIVSLGAATSFGIAFHLTVERRLVAIARSALHSLLGASTSTTLRRPRLLHAIRQFARLSAPAGQHHLADRSVGVGSGST